MKKTLLILCVLPLAGSVAFARDAAKAPFLGLDTKTVTNAWEGYFQDSFEWYRRRTTTSSGRRRRRGAIRPPRSPSAAR